MEDYEYTVRAERLYEPQKLTLEEQHILRKGERLLAIFDEKEREVIQEIKDGRKVWEMHDRMQDGSQQGEQVMQLPTLVANIENDVADQVDNMPDSQLIPENTDMMKNAEQMSDVLHYIFDRRNYKTIHRDLMVDMRVAKACVVQTFWDDDLNNGDGDVNITRWPIEAFRWDPAFDNIQDGRACFKLMWYPESWYWEHYPDVAKHIQFGDSTSGIIEAPYEEEGTEDRITLMVEYWYRKYDAKSHSYSVHLAKFAGGALLEYSEKDHPEGVYAHGMYPFDVCSYRNIANTPVGRSMVDDFIGVQRRANRLSHYIDENARMSARFKMIVNKNAEINKEQLMDWNQQVVETNGIPDDRNIRQLTVYQLNPQVDNHMQWLLDILKRESGQNDSARGEFGGGITAASAIQSLQEAGAKVSRMRTNSFQQCFKEIATKVLWLAAQFYTKKRVIFITGKEENRPDVAYEVDREFIYGKKISGNSGLPAPPYTVQVVVQRSNPQRIDQENQWVLQIAQMYAQAGVQVPVSSVIQMLNIPGKDRLMRVTEEVDARNDLIQQMQMQMQQAMGENEQLKKQNDALVQELSNTASMISGGNPSALPTLPGGASY